MKSLKVQSFILISIGFILGMSEFIIVGIINDLADSFDVGISNVGFLVTMFAIVYAILTPILTILVGEHRLKRVMLLLLSVFTVSNVMTAVANSFFILSLSRVLNAVVAGIAVSIAITFAAVIAPRDKRAWLISWVFSGYSVASVFGVPIGTWISDQVGWRWAFWIIVLISVMITVMFMLSLPGDLRQGKAKSLGEQFSLFKDPRILLGICLPILNLGGVYVVYTYLRPIVTSGLHFPTSFVTPFLFVFGLASLFSNQYSGRLANRDGLKSMVTVFVIQALTMLAISLLFGLPWAALAALIIMGLTMYLLNSPMQIFYLAVAEKDYPQSMVLASSLISIFNNVGIAVGSATGGVLFNHLRLKSLGYSGAVYTVVALVILIVLNRVRKSFD